MFVGVCVFEGVAIKTRSLIFKSINIHKAQKSHGIHGISTPKGQRIKKNYLHKAHPGDDPFLLD